MSLSNVGTYIYRPLIGERDFRLINLLQGAGDDPITLTIYHASLDSNPAYEALSYVWGPQHPAQIIQCNDSYLGIGENLAGALRCLRKPDVPQVLWVDRLAINQENNAERTRQVGLMADIYSLASAVVVWLGPADHFTDTAFGLLDKVYTQVQEIWNSQKVSKAARINPELYATVYPPSEDSRWLAIRSLLTRPWFSRVWTFQEIVLARNAHLYCGTHTRNWLRLEFFLTCLNTFQEGPNIEDGRLEGAGIHVNDIMKARQMFLRPETFKTLEKEDFLSLFPLLDSMRARIATDPRDKVFALLNVACDVKDTDLRADYGKSHAEVYAMTAKWLLRRTKSLGFLSFVEKKDKPDLISWVPDFRYKDFLNFLHQPAQVLRGIHRIYNASGTTKAKIITEESMFQLSVRGIYVGTIVDQTEPPGNMLNNIALGARVLDGGEWEIFALTCAIDGIYQPTGEPIDLAYHRLRIWDKVPGEVSRRQRKAPPTKIEPPRPETISYNGSNISGPIASVAMAILTGTTRKRLFKTDTGYMGLAHRSCQIGDQIYVLMGGDMPFVLRSLGGNFFGFGGESYVHGLMDGEMLAIAMGANRSLTRNTTKVLAWVDELGDEPWPFKTEVLTLV